MLSSIASANAREKVLRRIVRVLVFFITNPPDFNLILNKKSSSSKLMSISAVKVTV